MCCHSLADLITRQQLAQRNGCNCCADRPSLCGTRPAAAPRSCPTSGSGHQANPIPHAATGRSRRRVWISQLPCKSRRRWARMESSFGETTPIMIPLAIGVMIPRRQPFQDLGIMISSLHVLVAERNRWLTGLPGGRAPTRIRRTASCAAASATTSRRLRARWWPHAFRTGRPARQAAAPATAAARITTPTRRCRLARGVGKRQWVMVRRRRASAMRAGRASVAGRSSSSSSSSSRPSSQHGSNEPSAHRQSASRRRRSSPPGHR